MRKVLLLFLCFALLSSCAVTKTSNDFVFPTRSGKDKYIRAYNNALKLWSVKFEETDIITKFGSAHVLISGPKNGNPVVLFHGTDASSTMWYPNIKALSKKNRVYAIDYPLEAGKSVASVNNMELRDMILFYNDVFTQLKLNKFDIVGASRGAWVALMLTVEDSSRVKKLVLLSPAQTFGGVNQLGKAMSALTLKMFPSRKKLNGFFEQFSYYPEKIDQKYKEQFYLANKFGRSKPDLMKMKKFSKESLESLKMPILVLVGDHDVINDVDILEKARETIPNAETMLVKDAGHFLSIDQAEIVNKKMQEFLNL